MKWLPVIGCLALAMPACGRSAMADGYETLQSAETLLVDGENGTPFPREEKLSAAENVRLQRAAVARNAPALQKLREALQETIIVPNRPVNQAFFNEWFKCIDLGRILAEESDVRAADGDVTGALESRLDIVELSAALRKNAGYLGIRFGERLETMSGDGIAKLIARADAATLRQMASRLKAVEAQRPSYADTETADKNDELKQVDGMFPNGEMDPRLKAQALSSDGRARMGLNEAQATEFVALTPDKLRADLSEKYDPKIERDKLPFARARAVTLPETHGWYGYSEGDLRNDMKPRLEFEIRRTERLLFVAALEARATKLETGNYPDSLETFLDPFGDGTSIIYQRDGKGFLVYSVGPDGRDDGGEEIQTIETSPETGAKVVSGNVSVDSTGDIFGPRF